jgi:hypothetical protein
VILMLVSETALLSLHFVSVGDEEMLNEPLLYFVKEGDVELGIIDCGSNGRPSYGVFQVYADHGAENATLCLFCEEYATMQVAVFSLLSRAVSEWGGAESAEKTRAEFDRFFSPEELF